MDLELTSEQELIRASAREFAEREIAPHARDWDRAEEIDRSLVPKLADAGLLTGSKTFITLGAWASVALVFARTGGPGPKGITCFLVPTDAPGFEAHPIKGKLGLRAQDTSELSLAGVRVPDANRLGEL